MGPQLKPMLSDLARGALKYHKAGGKPKPHPPREPLLTLAEAEVKLKLPTGWLTTLFRKTSLKDTPQAVTRSPTNGHMYRLSEVRAYLKTKEQLQ